MADKIINSLEFENEYKKKFNIKTHCIYNPLNKKEIKKFKKKKLIFFFQKKYNKLYKYWSTSRSKDQITILKTFKKLKIETDYKFRLLIIGSGVNKNLLKKYIKKNKLNSCIKILNFQTNHPYLKKAEVFILSSLFEGLPNVLLESLSLKNSIISSNCPTGPKEILDNGKNGFLFKIRRRK